MALLLETDSEALGEFDWSIECSLLRIEIISGV
jgi:hypothetical protein